MSVELISILIAVVAVGAALAGIILTSSRGLRQDMAQLGRDWPVRKTAGGLRQDIRQDMARLESRLDERISEQGTHLEGKISEQGTRLYERISEQVAYLEGKIIGLRGRVEYLEK